jgi:uncharacterized membrane protein
VPKIEEHIDIAANQADVFRFCHNLDVRPEWDEQITRVEVLSHPPIRSGTLLRVDGRHAGGKVFSWDAEVIGYHFPQGSKIRVLDVAPSSPFATGSELSWEFSSVGGSTRLTWVWSYQPKGILARIFNSLGGGASDRRAIKNSLKNLKTMMESGRRA